MADAPPLEFEPIDSCYLCGAAGEVRYDALHDRVFDSPGQGSVLQCPRCGLHWLTPQLTRRHIGVAYRRYYTHDCAIDPVRLARLRAMVERLVFERAFGGDRRRGSGGRLLGKIVAGLPLLRETIESVLPALWRMHPGRVLDVGSGDGSLLAQLRDHGWEVHGIEMDGVAARVAHRKHDIPMVCGTVEVLSPTRTAFDVVIVRHVVEHVHDPVTFLQQCHRLLGRGGRLVVVTPNVESLGHVIFRRAWFSLDPPRHLFLFSRDTLSECARRAGLDGFSVRTLSGDARPVWQASRLILKHGHVRSGQAPLRFKVEGLVFSLVEEIIRRIKSSVGEEILLVAERGK